MNTRSFARNLFPPLDNPELTIRRRSRADPTLLNDFEMAAEGNGDPPVPDLRTMEELCQPSLNGRGGPIAPIAIQVMSFGVKNDMIQQVQNSCQFHGLPGDDANKHLDKFLHVTQSIKVNGVIDDALILYLFPHSLTHHATAWFDRLPRNYINTFERMAKMFLGKYFPPSMVTKLRNEITNFRQRGTFMKRRPEEFYDLIKNMRAHHNDWDTLAQQSESSSSITSSSDLKIIALKAEMAKINKNLMRVLQINHQVKAVTPNCETCGGPHSYNDCPATVGQTQNVYAAGAYQGGNPYQPQGPMIPTTSSSPPKVVERETEVTKDTMPPMNNRSTNDVQPPVSQVETPIPNFEPVVAPIIKPVVSPVNASKPNQKPSIPYLSRLYDQKLRDKANDQKGKFFQIFQDMNFNISFADALILMPKFGPTIKSLLTNKDKLYELSRTPLNEHCLAVLLKKLPEKLGDPGKFFIPYRSISRLVGVAEDVFVKVEKFHFPADFVVVDFDADPRVPLILERSFLKTRKALIDVYEGELTIHVGKEAITFNLDQTSRYSANYNDMMTNQIVVIDMAYEEYSLEVLGFSDVIASGNPTPYYDSIVSTSSPTLTPFRDSDFLLEEFDAFLALEYDPTSPKVDNSYYDIEGTLFFLKQFLIMIHHYPFPLKESIFLRFKKNLKFVKLKMINLQLMSLPRLNSRTSSSLILQHQIRVNPKIYDVIKKKVLKLLDARLIYPISDSPWEKSHFMVKEGIVLSLKISKNEIEVDKAKVDVIVKLPHPTTVKGPGDLPVPDLRTIEELCQPSLNGRGGPIAPIAIQAMNFGLKNDMI
nr:reverse transcriptase domain-containing protein [Tanacetum cinerariifolium]